MKDEPRLEEQAISKVAEMLLSSQIDTAGEIDIDIRTNLIKIAQGQTGAISISGKELVTQQDLQIKEVNLEIDQVDINLMSALLGKVELNQPIDSTGRITVTAADINRNLNSDYLRSRPIGLEVIVEGQPVLITFQAPMEIELPGQGKVIFSSGLQISEGEKILQSVRFKGAVYPQTDEHPVLMESFSLEDGQSLSLEIMVALINKLKELIQAPYVSLGEVTLKIQKMVVNTGSIDLLVKARINQLPA